MGDKILRFLFFATPLLALLLILLTPVKKYHYEYTDLDNNKGTATSCSYKTGDSYKSGQGSPVCILYDGTIKQVKEYKGIYDYEIAPIQEIFDEEVK